jgi:hypothetical protein
MPDRSGRGRQVAQGRSIDQVRARLVTIAIAIVVAACTPASNVGRSPSMSTPSSTPGEVPSPTGSTAPTSEPEPTVPTGWQQAAPMVYPRIDFRSALLTDGTLLAVGDDRCGIAGAYQGSERTEIYDPTADRWTEVGSLNKPRGGPQLMALPDGGAMVLGGVNEQDEEFSSTKVYSPNDRTWSDGPLMIRAGIYAAVALADGTVISVGRGGTEVLDPGATGWRRSTPPPKVFIERLFPFADGLVLAVGTNDNEDRDAAFLTFDPSRETWTSIAAASSYRSDVITLEDGSILVVGSGDNGTGVEHYDRAADRWVAGAPMSRGRYEAQVTRLADGRVLVAGGSSASGEDATDTTEIFDPGADTWTPGPPLLAPRQRGLAMSLPDGSVLVYGGHGPWSPPPSPDTGSTECPPPIAETERLYVVP